MRYQYPIVPFLWYIFGAYNVTIIITYVSVGFALSVPTQWQCESPDSWNDNCRVPRFLCLIVNFINYFYGEKPINWEKRNNFWRSR